MPSLSLFSSLFGELQRLPLAYAFHFHMFAVFRPQYQTGAKLLSKDREEGDLSAVYVYFFVVMLLHWCGSVLYVPSIHFHAFAQFISFGRFSS